MARRLHYIIFCLLLAGYKMYPQLYPTLKSEPGVPGMIVALDNVKDSMMRPQLYPDLCKGFLLYSDPTHIRFQRLGERMPSANEGILIADTKNSHFADVACNGPEADYPGRIYVCWEDEKFNPGNSDVFLAYSNDSGATWTEPILVTYRPNHKAQFMPQIITDRKGQVYLLYFDRQNSANNTLTDVYLAISKNGGLKFDYYRVNANPFKLSHVKEDLMLINSEPVIVGWVERKNEIYAVRIRDSILDAYNAKQADEEIQMPRTFAFSDTVKINFSLKKKSCVSAIITKPLEPGFEKWIVKNKKFKQGANTLDINTRLAGLKPGNYILTLYYNHRNTFAWIMADE